MLSDHFIDVFRQVMNSLPDSQFPTKHSDYRCFMLVHHLLKFELWAIFKPEEMRLDIFELLKTRGNLCFNTFMDPRGEMREKLNRDKKSFK